MANKWPFPGTIAVDRARAIATEYRRALMEIDPAAVDTIDNAAIMAGEGWIAVDGEIAVEDDDTLISVNRAAELVGRSPSWVYTNARLAGVLVPFDSTGHVRVRLGEIRELAAEARRRRRIR